MQAKAFHEANAIGFGANELEQFGKQQQSTEG